MLLGWHLSPVNFVIQGKGGIGEDTGNKLTHVFINSSHKYLVCHEQSTGDTSVNELPMGLSGLMAGTNGIANDFPATVLSAMKEKHRMPLEQTLEDLL